MFKDSSCIVTPVVLNWNAGADTIETVNSIIEHITSVTQIVVVDNASSDDSLSVIGEHASRSWALEGWKLRELSDVQCADNNIEIKHEKTIFLLKNSNNSGYAGGNNLGMSFALSCLSTDYVWILNNDVVFKDDALTPMLEKMGSGNKLGFVGSVVLNANKQSEIECVGGGKYFPLLGKAKLSGKGMPYSHDYVAKVSTDPDYIMGCSLLVDSQVIKNVGYMDESYFMYSEEIDWQKRASKDGWGIAVADESIVLHWGSKSSGGQGSNYHFYRNRAAIMYNKKFYGVVFSWVSAIMLSGIIVLQGWRRPKHVVAGVKGVFGALVN